MPFYKTSLTAGDGGGKKGERERYTDQVAGRTRGVRRAGAVWKQLKAAPRGSNVPVMVVAVAGGDGGGMVSDGCGP